MRLTAVVDGTGAGAQRQGTALGAFMREGLAIGDAGARRGDGAQPTGDTVVFYEIRARGTGSSSWPR